MKAVIFDFDGVIHDTFDFHRKKLEEYAGLTLSEQDFRDIHNGNFFKSTVAGIQNMNWLGYRDYINLDIAALKIKDNIKKVLLELNNRYELFIVTSGGTKNISDYLKNNNVLDVFKEILGLEANKMKVDKFNFIFNRYALVPADCIFVTDTLGDILEANTVNLKTIAIDSGFHNRETLERGNPFRMISSMEELSDNI
ncbi:HAD hydrolase-like protein [Candidatus Parcubacteria bacterium]|nr:HAD hydrolase-like protein [Patescibacteria group bacterium]MBU4308989.1 HAD hydrolase-like protein [Patescibacteria group bacterium]MBU4432220.1 HAD hydrolase-like protein [Patescibacteria group bacterium]MBU4577349.1 HAD hydrolase-like protein [Patescibacteria group bacterium]MCG2697037.1 HAD hydrolase-like protein [Candidatus Parcubacteria bacterium]